MFICVNDPVKGQFNNPNPNLHPIPSPSQLSGNYGEGSYRTTSFQLQSRQEAVGCLAGSPRLQGLAQAAPRFVGSAVDLNCITKDLLPEVDAPCFHQQTALDKQMDTWIIEEDNIRI